MRNGKCAVKINKFSLMVTLAVAAFSIGISTAGPAAAECIGSSGVDVCAMGGSSGAGGMAYPYACEYDWYCDGGTMSLMFTSDDSGFGPPNTGGLNEGRTGGMDRGPYGN